MILTAETARKKIRRLAMEIAERHEGSGAVLLIGIRENGIYIARKIAEHLEAVYAGSVELIELSLDKKNPREINLNRQTDLSGKSVILIDDVANSGRTLLYSLKPQLDYDLARVETLALVERTHKRYPIAVDYVGLSVATTHEEEIVVGVDHGEVTGAWFKH